MQLSNRQHIFVISAPKGFYIVGVDLSIGSMSSEFFEVS